MPHITKETTTQTTKNIGNYEKYIYIYIYKKNTKKNNKTTKNNCSGRGGRRSRDLARPRVGVRQRMEGKWWS
jgi:hypothetical protein